MNSGLVSSDQISYGKLTFWCSLASVRLHSHMRVQMIKCAIRLLAPLPTALVHALDLLEPSARPFMLRGARYWDKRINSVDRVVLRRHVSYEMCDRTRVRTYRHAIRSHHAGSTTLCGDWHLAIHLLSILVCPCLSLLILYLSTVLVHFVARMWLVCRVLRVRRVTW